MFRLLKSNVMHRGKHLFQRTTYCRPANSLLIKDSLIHQEHTSKTSNEPTTHKFISKQYLIKNDYIEEKEIKHRYGHSNQVSMLLGVIGTVTVLSIGSALCESQEESESETSKELNTSLGESVDVRDICPTGEDIVGTERETYQIKMASQGSRANFQTVSESSGVQERYNSLSVHKAIEKSQQILKRCMEEAGAPGLSVAVSVDGVPVWTEGFGYADVENGVPCSPDTVMRIASISKSLTMTAVAKLWEEGKLDLDAPIQKYIPSFPVKTFDGEEVTITTRHLISNMSGIRHYKLKGPIKKEKEEDEKEKLGKMEKAKEDKLELNKKEKEEGNKEKKKIISVQEDENKKETTGKNEKDSSISTNEEVKTENKKESSNFKETRNEKCGCSLTVTAEKKKELEKLIKAKANKKKKGKMKETEEFDCKEYYIKEEFETIQEALELFQNDELFFKPGSQYLYTTHGWTVVSGVVEGASKKPFTKVMSRLFYDMGLQNTYLDQNTPLIYNRARYYIRDKRGVLKNAPYVDNSYKWAGGGFLSTVLDLTKFGNAMLYASQQENGTGNEGSGILPGILKASTMQILWTPVEGNCMNWIRDEGYGMGWVAHEEKSSYGCCKNSRPYAYHTGAAVGASSVLHILPKQVTSNKESGNPPKGIVVAVITNMQEVRIGGAAVQIARLFDNVQ